MRRKNFILIVFMFLFVNILSMAIESTNFIMPNTNMSSSSTNFQEALKDYKPNLENIDKIFNYIEKNIKEEKRQSGLGIASMVLGIIAIVISFAPFINIVILPLAIIAILFGILTLIRRSVKKSFAISGIILSIFAIIIAFSITLFAITMVEKSGRELERIARESKEKTKFDVTNVELKIDEKSTKVTGKIKNISGEKKEFVVVSIPSVDKDTGKQIIDIYSVSRNLSANGVWEFEGVSNQTVKNAKIDEKNIRVFGM